MKKTKDPRSAYSRQRREVDRIEPAMIHNAITGVTFAPKHLTVAMVEVLAATGERWELPVSGDATTLLASTGYYG